LTFLIVLTFQSNLREDESPVKRQINPLKSTDPDATRTIQEIVVSRGYPLETHFITTQDGYILKVFRIPGPKGSTTINQKPCLLQHGLFDSADSFIIHREEMSYSYHLANNGYDVWLGNSRGNKHSRTHVKYSADKDKQFWDFTYHEMGIYDIPATLEYIKLKTGKPKIAYIGHSQGSTQIFLGMSLLPEYYKNSLTGVIGLGPATSMANMGSTFLSLVARSKLDVLMQYLGVNEFLPSSASVSNLIVWLCDVLQVVCDGILEMLADSNAEDDDPEKFPVFLGHFPSGTSSKDLTHFAQNTRSKLFAQYDYGTEKNMELYKQPTPPEYDLTKIQNKVCLFVGKDDRLATPADNRIFNETLKKIGMSTWYKEYDNMGHLTFFLPKDFSYNNDLMNCMKEFEKEI